jgi:putative heme iron utilization protein
MSENIDNAAARAEAERDAREKALAAAGDFDAVGVAKHLLRTIRAGALATLDRADGTPFASLTTVATDSDGSPLLLMSQLSAHTQNLQQDPRASILLAQAGKGDPLAHPRLTVIGRATVDREPRLRERFLARHPKARLYADFGDFSFWRLEIERAHLNGGFARARDLDGSEIRTDLSGADDLLAAEADAVAHMNADHREALALYATRLSGAPSSDWRATGLDPEGMDLAAGDLTARTPFRRRVTTADDLRRHLKELADAARATPEQARE